MQVTRDFSHYVKDAGPGLQHIDLAVEGVHCAGCMAKIERGLSAIPDVTLARVNLTDRRVALHRSPRRARLQGLSVRDGERGGERGRALALPAPLPRRCRLRHHERDDAVDPGVVG
jgi:cation transport ATPase